MKILNCGPTPGLNAYSAWSKELLFSPENVFSKMVLMWMLLMPGLLNSQGVIKSSITYVEESKVYYQYNDSLGSFSIQDKVKLLPEITKDSVIRLVYANSDLKTTFFHLENNQFESWMKIPKKTIIDKSSVRVYDRFGTVLINQVHSAKYKHNYSALKSYANTNHVDFVPDFLALTNTLKQEMLDSGFVMSNLGSGYYKFSKDSVQLIFNNSLRSNELLLFKNDGTFKYSIKKGYIQNVRGQIVPSYIVEKKWDPRFPGNCVKQVSIKEYPYYTITNFLGKFSSEESFVGDIIIYPNPASEVITIALPEASDNFLLTLFDNLGRIVYTEQNRDFISELTLDISHFENGVYVLQIKNDAVFYTKSFVKS